MASANLSGDWNPIPAEGDRASIQTTAGQRLCIAARHVSADGNVSEWDFITHDVEGKVELDRGPADVLIAACQGQIAVKYSPPPVEDFDYIQIAIGDSEDPSTAALVYEGRDVQWASKQVYSTSARYFVFLRGLDTSRNPSAWTDPIPVVPSALTDRRTGIAGSHASVPNQFLGQIGGLYVVIGTGALWAKSATGWWLTGINVHASGPTQYYIASSDVFVPRGQSPLQGRLGVPVGLEIPSGSTAIGSDGRTWTWSPGGQRFFEAGDSTPATRIPSNLPDWQINAPPASCGRIIPVTRFPPLPLEDGLEGVSGETKPAYDICVSDDGTIGDYINGKWAARQVRWKRISQPGEVLLRKDTPAEWTWFDTEPVESDRAKQYGDTWRTVVSLNLGFDGSGDSYYGQMYIRNFRTKRWEKYYQLCDPDVPEPAAPRNLSLSSADFGTRISVTASWDPPASRAAPQGYRYRVFRKVQFDSDVERASIMSGFTSLTEVQEPQTIDPPERFYLEVRAEYETGNSRWVRIEARLGLSCADDPPPLAQNLYFAFSRPTPGSTAAYLPFAIYNGVRGYRADSQGFTVYYDYIGSGTEPAWWAFDQGPNEAELNPTVSFAPGSGITEFPRLARTLRLADPVDGHLYTLVETKGRLNDYQPVALGSAGRTQAQGEFPGLLYVLSGRGVSQCGEFYQWGERRTVDVWDDITPSVTPFSTTGSVTHLSNVTPQGAPAGTYHFQYRTDATFGGGEQLWVQFCIRGWHLNERGVPAEQVRFFGFAAAGSLPAGISDLPGGTGRQVAITTGTNATNRVLVVTGMPTDFDGWYTISARPTQRLANSPQLYGFWRSIRFETRGTRRPPPLPSVGIPLNVSGNESPQSSQTWEFGWVPPTPVPERNILPALGYDWEVTGQTVRSGASVLNRISVANLNEGAHTLTLRATNGLVRSLPVTYPFFVRIGPPMCTVRPPVSGRQIPSGSAGLAIVQFDAPPIGSRPTSYPWTLTATGPPPGGTQVPVVPSGKESGTAAPTTAGGTVRIESLPPGVYALAIRSRGCTDPVGTSEEALTVPVTLTGQPPEQPFPPRNLRVQEGASRTTAESTWEPPTSGPRPDGYEYKIDGQTTQAPASTISTNAIHVNLNPGLHTLSVRSTKTGVSPSVWVTRDFVVRGAGCHPVESLEEGIGGTRDAPIWNARRIFWAAPIGGMPATGYLWELFDSAGGSLRSGTATLAERRVELFNLAEGTYSVAVRANCADGPSAAKSVGFTAVCPSPEPPEQLETIVSGLSDSQVASVTWQPPSTGGRPTEYIWELIGPESRGDRVPSSTLTLTLEGLPKGEYQLRVRSFGECDKTSGDTINHFTIGVERSCNSPRVLRKVEGQIWSTWTVLWLAPSSGETPLRYDWRMEGPTQPSGTIQPNAADNLSGEVTVDNLIPGRYSFHVKTICNLTPATPGEGESKESSISITVVRKAPENPRNVDIESVTSSVVFEGEETPDCPPTPSWVGTWDPPLGGTAPSNYDWELYNASTNERILSSTVPSITRRAVLGRLAPGFYRFQVRSKSGTQVSGWEGKSATVPLEALNPPNIRSATPMTDTSTRSESWTVVWGKNPCGVDPTGYDWRWREAGAAEDMGSGSTGTSLANRSRVLSGGINGRTYTFYVLAKRGIRRSVEAQTSFVWGEALAIHPPENLDTTSRDASGSSVEFDWDPPSEGLAPARYNWELTGPNTNMSGDNLPIQFTKDFTGLESGSYTFRVRSDVRGDSTDTAVTSGPNQNVSTWATARHLVVGADVARPGPIRIERTQTTVFGSTTTTVVAKWGASDDSAVTGYQWEGSWTAAPSSGSTGTSAEQRQVNLDHVPKTGFHTITVWAVKGGSRSGSRAKRFTLNFVEKPINLSVAQSDDRGSTARLSWNAAPTGARPLRYNYIFLGPGFLRNGSTTSASITFRGLADGTYAFSVRADVRASVTESPVVPENVSGYESIGFNVSAADDAPGEISLVSTAGTLRGPDWKGGETVSYRLEWDPSSDTEVDGYDWIGTWSHSPPGRTGSTGTGATARRISLGDIPIGRYTVTVYSTKNGARGGFRSKDFEIPLRPLEPPSGLEVESTGDADSGWNHELSFDPPETGRLVDGFEYRRYMDGEEPPGVWRRTTETEIEITFLDDGDWKVDLRTYDIQGSSDHVTAEFKQPPDNLKMQPPEGVKAQPGTGADWNGASLSWRPPSGENPLEPDEFGWRVEGPTQLEGTETALTHTVTNLKVGDYTLYAWCIKEGYENSEEVGASFTIAEPPPEAAAGLKCEDGSSRTQKLISWRNPSSGTRATGAKYSVSGATNIPETPLAAGTTRFTLDLETGTSTVTVILTATSGTEELESEPATVECDIEAVDCKPPRDLTVTQNQANNRSWNMRWKPPEVAAGEPAPTGYGWELSGDRTETGETSALVTSQAFSDLEPGDYSFKVRTLCGDDDPSDFTPQKDFTVEEDPIYPPEGLSVSQDEDEAPPRDVTVSWTANDEGRMATGYKIRLTGTSTVAETAASGTSHTFSQLAAGSYTVYVRATIGDDESDREASESFDVETPEVLPVMPTGLSHSLDEDGTSVTYSWSYPSDGPEIDGFQVTQRGGTGQRNERLDKSTLTWQQDGLRIGSQYTMTVAGVDSDGNEGPSATVTFTAEAQQKAPLTPLNFKEQVQVVSAELVGAGDAGRNIDVTLSWMENTDGPEAETYTLNMTHESEWTGSDTSHKYTGVIPGEKTATVTANNDAGSSEPATISFTIDDECNPPGAVRDLAIDTRPAERASMSMVQKAKSYFGGLSLLEKVALIAVVALGAAASAVAIPVAASGLGVATTASITVARLILQIKVIASPAGGLGLGLATTEVGAGALAAFLAAIGLAAASNATYAGRITWMAPEVDDDHRAAKSYSWGVFAGSRVLDSGTTEETSVDVSLNLVEWVEATEVRVVASNDCGNGGVAKDTISVGEDNMTFSRDDEECLPPPTPMNGNATRGGGSPVVHLSWSAGNPDLQSKGKTIAYVVEGSGTPYGDGTTTGTTMQFHGDEIDSADGGAWTVWAVAEGGCTSDGLGIGLESTPNFDRVTTVRIPRKAPSALVERVTTVVTYPQQP